MACNNRHKCSVAVLVIIITLINLAGCGGESTEKISKSDFVLNTVATITLYDGGDEALIDECFALCRRYEAMFSRTDENSEIYKLNSRRTSVVSDETAELIKQGLYYGALTDGAFDISVEPLAELWNFTSENPSVPSEGDIEAAREKVDYRAVSVSGSTVTFANDCTRIDLGGIAKGYIADRVKEFLISSGVKRAIINLGGNVLCIGGKSGEQGFKIGIQYPFRDGSIASVTVKDLSVVTSGTYERYFTQDGKLYHHILDPKTGYPCENGLVSVTIIGESSCVCDALSTSCFVLGKDKGMELIDDTDGYYGIFITDKYELYFTRDAENKLNAEY